MRLALEVGTCAEASATSRDDDAAQILFRETLRLTNLGKKGPGDRVNIELDARTVAIVDTVERVLEQRFEREKDAASGP
jgi:riboflavin synthase